MALSFLKWSSQIFESIKTAVNSKRASILLDKYPFNYIISVKIMKLQVTVIIASLSCITIHSKSDLNRLLTFPPLQAVT